MGVNPVRIYGFLFFCAVTLINPLGSRRSEIWVDPKLAVLVAIGVFQFFWIAMVVRRKKSEFWSLFEQVFNQHKWLWLTWIAALVVGTLSTILSPFPERSFWAHPELRDGLFFWAVLLLVAVGASFVARFNSQAVRSAEAGVVAGVALHALVMIVQVIDWRFDFTATSFVTNSVYSEMLASTVWKSQMPIGLYLHRAQASYMVGLTALCLLIYLPRITASKKEKPVLVFIGLLICVLILGNSRGVLIPFALAFLLILWQKLQSFGVNLRKQVWKRAAVLGLAVIFFATTIGIVFQLKRPIVHESAGKINVISGGRWEYWQNSLKLVRDRPVLGWGFNGYGVGAPTLERCARSAGNKVTEVLDYNFVCHMADGSVRVFHSFAAKAHNWVLDQIVAFGLDGAIAWFLFIGSLFAALMRQGLAALALYAFIYLLFWYDTSMTTPWLFLLAATRPSGAAIGAVDISK